MSEAERDMTRLIFNLLRKRGIDVTEADDHTLRVLLEPAASLTKRRRGSKAGVLMIRVLEAGW